MGVIHLASHVGMRYDKILEAMNYGFSFRAKDEKENIFMPDFIFMDSLAKEFEMTIIKYLGFDSEADKFVIEELKKFYNK
jgi:hypothetical protein